LRADFTSLGATSTQYGESYHLIIRQTSNAQLPLEESIRRLIQKLEQVYCDLATDEDLLRIKAADAVDMKVFDALIGSVIIYAIDKQRIKWNSVLHIIANQDITPLRPTL
jgi:hypothetical protein